MSIDLALGLCDEVWTISVYCTLFRALANISSKLLLTIAEHGYAKATIQVIAIKAGIALGLLHYHFNTKVEILVELVKALAEKFAARDAALSASAVSPEEYLFAYVNARPAKGEGENPAVVGAWVVIGSEAVRMP